MMRPTSRALRSPMEPSMLSTPRDQFNPSSDMASPIDPEDGNTASTSWHDVDLPVYHMYHRVSLSPR